MTNVKKKLTGVGQGAAILAFILAGLYVCGGLVGIASSATSALIVETVAETMGDLKQAYIDLNIFSNQINVYFSLINLGLVVLYIVGGVRMIKLKPKANILLAIVAIVDIVTVLAKSIITMVMINPFMKQFAAVSTEQFKGMAFMETILKASGSIGIVIGLIFGLLFPALIVIFLFSHSTKIQFETVAEEPTTIEGSEQ